MNQKITEEHLRRRAIVYVRQSTPIQLVQNRESQLERSLKDIDSTPRPTAVPDKEVLLSLAQDLPAVWNASADMGLKQRIAEDLD